MIRIVVKFRAVRNKESWLELEFRITWISMVIWGWSQWMGTGEWKSEYVWELNDELFSTHLKGKQIPPRNWGKLEIYSNSADLQSKTCKWWSVKWGSEIKTESVSVMNRMMPVCLSFATVIILIVRRWSRFTIHNSQFPFEFISVMSGHEYRQSIFKQHSFIWSIEMQKLPLITITALPNDIEGERKITGQFCMSGFWWIDIHSIWVIVWFWKEASIMIKPSGINL
jgi:hypothetical protein